MKRRCIMPITTTYTDARARLAELWNRLEEDRELLVIERRGHEAMAMLPAAEVESLLETAHLLRSPKNALRLLNAIQQALSGEGEVRTLEELKQDLGVG
jgi:antitoxin YefM